MSPRAPITRATGFERSFEAVPEELWRIRAAVREWLNRNAIKGEVQTDLVLAVSEACANAVEHAYDGRQPGEVEVEIERVASADELVVHIRDAGRWRPLREATWERGRGMQIMRALVDDLKQETGPTGTVVSFRKPLHSHG